MRSNTEISRALNYRRESLEKSMEAIEKRSKEEGTNLPSIYWEQYAVHSEVCALSEWIRDFPEKRSK